MNTEFKRSHGLALVIFCMSLPALGGGSPVIYTDASTALTRAAPLDGSREGFDLGSMTAWVYKICCPTGQTVTSGNAKAYWQDPSDGKWSRTPILDFASISSETSCWTSPQMRVSLPFGRGLEAADSIVCSGASTSISSKTIGFTQ